MSAPVRERVPWLAPKETSIDVRIGAQAAPIALRDRSELETMRETLLEGEYADFAVSDPHTVIDIGANIGLASIFFRERYPNAYIAAVEANPATVARLERNVAPFNVAVVRQAVAGHTGMVTFWITPQSPSASIRSRPHSTPVQIPAVTIPSLREQLDFKEIDLLKLDIEGGEWDALRVPGALSGVRTVVAELHFDLAPTDAPEVADLFPGFEIRVRQRTAKRALLWGFRSK